MQQFKFLINNLTEYSRILYEYQLRKSIESCYETERNYPGYVKAFAEDRTPKLIRILEDKATLEHIEFHYRISYFEGLTRITNDYVKIYTWQEYHGITQRIRTRQYQGNE